MKILHLDSNHPILKSRLNEEGFINEDDFASSKEQVEDKISQYDGIVIRSRFKIDQKFIDRGTNLKFIARVGAGLESIDCAYACTKDIALIAAPEGNRNAVGEHALALLLALFNKIIPANDEVNSGLWNREKNRGHELDGKVVGIIGYGNMGQAFAKKLRGFDVEVLCYDLKNDVGNELARQVSLEEFYQKVQIVSLHTPLDSSTLKLIDAEFIQKMKHPFWLLNTARGPVVHTVSVVEALQSGKILGAGLDVLEYEKSSFEKITNEKVQDHQTFEYLKKAENVILTPHIGGWTFESHEKLANVIVDKILNLTNTLRNNGI